MVCIVRFSKFPGILKELFQNFNRSAGTPPPRATEEQRSDFRSGAGGG
jgi:hypothetical protein